MAEKLKLLGSRFTSVSAKKNDEFEGKLSINTNLRITNMEQNNESDTTMKVDYTFKIDYADLGEIELVGRMFVGGESDSITEMVKGWEEKKFDTPEQAAVTNIIIQKVSIKAFELEEELGLPIHVRLPTVKLSEE